MCRIEKGRFCREADVWSFVCLIVECANVRASVDGTHEGCGRQMAARFMGRKLCTPNNTWP